MEDERRSSDVAEQIERERDKMRSSQEHLGGEERKLHHKSREAPEPSPIIDAGVDDPEDKGTTESAQKEGGVPMMAEYNNPLADALSPTRVSEQKAGKATPAEDAAPTETGGLVRAEQLSRACTMKRTSLRKLLSTKSIALCQVKRISSL